MSWLCSSRRAIARRMGLRRWPACNSSRRRRVCSSSAPDLSSFVVEGSLTKLGRGEIPQIGVEAQVTHTFTLADTTAFAQLNGDNNPIHLDANYVQKHFADQFDGVVVQGMLSASLFATIFGQTIPGSLYVSQQLRFRTPLFVDQPVCAKIRVEKVKKRFVECATTCVKTQTGQVVVDGKAIVFLPAPTSSDS